MTYRTLTPGEPAPWFYQRSTAHPRYAFHTAAGSYVILCFFGSAADVESRRRLDAALRQRALFDDVRMAFFGISVDPADEESGRVQASPPGMQHFWDFDGSVSRLYGALPAEPCEDMRSAFRTRWVLLSPGLHVLAVLPFDREGGDLEQVTELLTRLPPVSHFVGSELHAPVLALPLVFDESLCRKLMEEHERHGGTFTGVMREQHGMTMAVDDPRHKVRSDHLLDDDTLCGQTRLQLARKVVPAVRLAYQFEATRVERYLVGCYDAASGGHFRAHRDNTTRGTAHRRFAISINLNDDFDGGELVFPEFGPKRYRPPAGSAIVFSCSLLHAVTPVRRGRRYAFLPFLHDERAEAIRDANHHFLAGH
jgi:predicted 2-oxoglutarate/Fe(II)-dependent dioxygenase YbiX/peroxiredoxin